MREIFSLDGMSSRILGGRWEDLDEGRRNQFTQALVHRLLVTANALGGGNAGFEYGQGPWMVSTRST